MKEASQLVKQCTLTEAVAWLRWKSFFVIPRQVAVVVGLHVMILATVDLV